MRGWDPTGGLRCLAVSVVLFGGIWPITKDAFAQGATPLGFAVARAGLAALAGTVVLAALGRLRLPGRADLPAVVAIGTLQLGAFFALTHVALEHVPAGRTAILGNVTVIWLVPLSAWLLADRVGPAQWVAAGLGLAGVAVLAAPWGPGGADAGATALLLGAGLAWSLAIVATRVWPPRRPVFELLPWCFALATLLLAGLAAVRDPGGGIGTAWWQAGFVGAIAAPIGTWATIEAGRRLSATLASVGFLLVPVVGVALATLWLNEALGADLLLGGALILVGVGVAARAR